MNRWVKRFRVELFDENDLEIETYEYDLKTEQLEQYYHLLNKGYKRSQVVKSDFNRLEDC